MFRNTNKQGRSTFQKMLTNSTPRVDDHGMSIRSPFGIVGTCLGGGDNVGLRFDGPRTQQRLPVGLPSLRSERRGHQHHLCAGAGYTRMTARCLMSHFVIKARSCRVI